MDLGIEDRVALVTGAGQGIGRQICLTLAQEGARVAVNDIIGERAKAVSAEIRQAGGQAICVVADVTDGNAVKAMVQGALQEWGRLDILVNNAGMPRMPNSHQGGAAVGGRVPFSQSDRAFWEGTMDVSIWGVLHCTRAAIEGMIERRWGRIVNITSDAGRVGLPKESTYSLAKAGVVGFTKAVAREVGPHGITVNCVSPGTIVTETSAGWVQANRDRLFGFHPLAAGLDRLGQTSDVANAVAFLVSQRAEWITGQVLSVNGGRDMVD
ncbi:MAG TPA: 3-oxoacyl-ACP reductase family protein [Dehalococcoidia bacterium]|nr:3-oxoacyl-ACP reductase family protein [Dehalococcoidia bacterium]